MTPINQLAQYIIHDTEADTIEPEVSLIIGMLITIEAEYILTLRTKDERRTALETLPPKIRADVERQVMITWQDQKRRYSDKDIARKPSK
jgi:hypothetical protein